MRLSRKEMVAPVATAAAAKEKRMIGDWHGLDKDRCDEGTLL